MTYLHQRRCDMKKLYPSGEFAERVAESASKKSGHWIIAYECFDCGGWHIGHAPLEQQLAFRPIRAQEESK